MKNATGPLVLVLGFAALALAVWWLRQPQEGPAADTGRHGFVVPVTLVQAETRDLAPRARLTGSVRATRRARVGFDAAGLLAELRVQEADAVEAGQVLAVLDSRDETLELQEARDALTLAQRELDLLEAGERPEEVRRLEANLAAARAEAELARLEVERGRNLLTDHVISQAEQDSRVAAADAARERAVAAEQDLARAKAGARSEDLAIAKAKVSAARTRVAAAEHEIAKTELHAPWAGVVVSRSVSTGDYLAAGDEVYELVDLDHLEVDVEIPGRLADRVEPGAEVLVRASGPDATSLRAHLDAKVQAADERSRGFRGIVRLGPDELAGSDLRPGMFCELDLALTPLAGALAVPSDCVLVGEAGEVVVRAVAAPPAEGAPAEAPPGTVALFVPVRVLAEADGWKAVEPRDAPLAAGDAVVLTGADNAFPGAPLLVHEDDPPAAPAEGAAGAPAGPTEEAAAGAPAAGEKG